MIPLLGFAPDLDSTTDGVLTDCAQFIPYETGMEAAPSPVTPTGISALASACLGAAVVTKLDNSRRAFAGTSTKLWELVAGVWTDRSSATYTGGSDTRWSFAQFGDTTIASNRADIMQSSASGAFANITGAPKAEIVYPVNSFVMALNVNDGAEKPNGWHCCASFDETDWAEDVTTQSASGELVASAGLITAGMSLGEYATAYKQRSIYIGQYVGAPSVWDWILVPGGEAGCIGKEAICDVGGAHFIVGADNIWIFNGTSPTPVGDQIRQWFYDNSSSEYLYRTKCVFDRQQNRVWVFYPGIGSTTCDSALVYHLLSKRWGRANRDVEATLNYTPTGLTIDTLDTVASTIDALPDIGFDSPFWGGGTEALSIFSDSHVLQTMTGASEVSSFTSGDIGEDDAVSLLKQIRLRFSSGRAPTAASVTVYHKMSSGDDFVVGSTTTINDGKFDVMQAARWHRAVVTMTGPARVTAMRTMLENAGER